MIKKINTGIPEDTNKRIINQLLCIVGWKYAQDYNVGMNLNRADAGFTLSTFDNNPNNIQNPCPTLNTYAYMILDIVNKNQPFKITTIKRFFWNWYHPGSQMMFHLDAHSDKDYSIIYNPSTNDGGTQFRINEKIDFYKSVESEALIFPSKVNHTGVAPIKYPNRFSLNIVGEI